MAQWPLWRTLQMLPLEPLVMQRIRPERAGASPIQFGEVLRQPDLGDSHRLKPRKPALWGTRQEGIGSDLLWVKRRRLDGTVFIAFCPGRSLGASQ